MKKAASGNGSIKSRLTTIPEVATKPGKIAKTNRSLAQSSDVPSVAQLAKVGSLLPYLKLT